MGTKSDLEVWAGIECTINRVKDSYFDQLTFADHYNRISDLDLFAELGVKKLGKNTNLLQIRLSTGATAKRL
jgi:dTDP-4-dehydrorhamnose reductase